MDNSLNEVFSRHFSHVVFDEKLATEIYKYHIYLSTMNPEHIQFFGGNLLGVNILRYTPKDIRRFYDTILDVDYATLEEDVRKVPTIYHENSISGDILNLTLFYMIHRFFTTPKMSEPRRQRAAYDVALIFCYRCTFALTNNYFKYPVDPKVAQAAYANLSNKHLIKKYKTWKNLCDYRAKRIVEKVNEKGQPGLNYQRLYLFNDDLAVTSMIQDSQGRFKSIFSIYYNEFDKVHKDGRSIAVTSATITDVDGDEVIREKTKGVEPLINYSRELINDGAGFIDPELITVVADMNANSSYKMIKSVLEWLTQAYHDPKHNKAVDKFMVDVIVQSMYYIEHNIPINQRKDLVYILVTLKNLYLSTRSTDPQLLSIRQQGEKLIKIHSKKASTSLISATRSAIILYITLRVLVGNRGR